VEKANPSGAPAQKADEGLLARSGVASAWQHNSARFGSFASLQHALGNQALLGLLNSHRIQTKSRSGATDEFEAEADRAAELVVQRTRAPGLQRKCAGGDSCACAKCSGEDDERRQLSSTPTRIQRQAKDAKQPAGESAAEARHGKPRSFIVDDEAPSTTPGQMRKSAFLDRLEADVCATADAELAAAGRSAESCPYIEKWLAHYRKQSSAHIEQALVKYAPEAATAKSANDYFGIVDRRVRQAVATWAKTGKVTGVPPGVSVMLPSTGADEKSAEGFGAGIGKALSGAVKLLFKTRDSAAGSLADPEAVRSQLGSGRALDSHARTSMESAFGHDFSGVRIHTDSRADHLSSQLNARAFTVGNDIAFAGGEFRPGTIVGDALLAHELAHVVQQKGTSPDASRPAGHDNAALEAEADQSAAGAVSTTWLGATAALGGLARNAAPRIRSGLRLSRCSSKGKLLINFEEKFPDAAAQIRKSESAMKLVKEADDAGVKFGGYAEDESGRGLGRAYTLGDKVYIPKAQADSILSMRNFLFELNNAMRESKFSALNVEADKGTKGTLAAKDYAYRMTELEVEGMLRTGEVWFATKQTLGPDKKWDKYDNEFYLAEYQAFKDGKKTKDDIVKDVLSRKYDSGTLTGKTTEQYYMDIYQTRSGGK
jgi:hypothetical protein